MKTKQGENIKTLIMRNIKCVVIFLLIIILISSCSKTKFVSQFPGTSHLNVRMTDAAANFTAVMIDLQGVEVADSDSVHEVMLSVNKGVYNLLNFSNGLDTLIASGDLGSGLVPQIRLILGPNNTVMVDSVSYPLSAPSAMQSGLKLQIHKVFQPGESYSILLDFDANQSIVDQGNGNYLLKPVIRTVDTALTGSIKGSVAPIGSNATIIASSNGLTYSSVTDPNGKFLIAGLPPGTYDVTVFPALPLLPVTLTGKIVTVGVVTNIGTVELSL